MTEATENQVAPGQGVSQLMPGNPRQDVAIQNAMPCITILVHGVNDVGEAFPHQEEGLCKGLNTRLCRADMKPGEWEVPPLPKNGKEYTVDDVHSDPDKVYFQRKPDMATSMVIPFYWGFREVTKMAKTEEAHGQYLDSYKNRIDKRYAKNGGPFANATTNIPDMFGPGFDTNWMVRLADPNEATHPIYTAAHRSYMVLAAQRLAALIRIIRKQSPEEPINIVAHSQGCFITLLAHAILAKYDNGVKADTVVLNNPPYSVDEPFIEWLAQSRNEQQSAEAREETLHQIIGKYMTQSPATQPEFATLTTCRDELDGCVGMKWKPDAKKERDNRGKVYLYFSPDDATVGLPNIMGIGWWGVHEALRKKLGAGFFQRLFTSPTGINEEAPPIGSDPHPYTVRFKWNAGFTRPRDRMINGEPLEKPFKPDLGKAKLKIEAIDAAVAITNTYNKKDREGMQPGETPEQALARWMNDVDDNSYHSSIVSNYAHSEQATAYDISIGVSNILRTTNVTWINFLRAVADWRTNWLGTAADERSDKKDPSFPPPSKELVKMLDQAIDAKERDIILGNYNYYSADGEKPGTLPELTTELKVKDIHPFVVSETINEKIKKNQHENFNLRN